MLLDSTLVTNEITGLTGRDDTSFAQASFTLASLSPQARKFAGAVATQPDFLNDLLLRFSQNSEQAWSYVEERFGILSQTDRRLLEVMSQVFLPQTSISIVTVTNGGSGGGSGGCWAH